MKLRYLLVYLNKKILTNKYLFFMGKNKEIIKYNENGEEICRYPSAKIAYESENINEHKFRKIIGKNKYINGFRYDYSGIFSDEIDKSDWKFKCPYCDEVFETYNGLCKHVFRFSKHNCESKEQLLTDFAYNGIRPKCKCGCGEYTDISYEGGAHFCDYKLGHSSRVHNNWGHNKDAIAKSTDTRRKQYESGERIQWNKGKKWNDTFSEEKIAELMKIYSNEERNNKISEKLYNVPKSEEHAKKCRENGSSEYAKKRIREALYNRIKDKQFSLSSKFENDFIDNFIKPLNIEYETQYYLNDINQYCDIFIPSKNLIIECDGSFWHCDKRLFPEGAIYDYQKRKIEKDKIKNEYLKYKGYNLLRFWELDIINEPEMIKEEILNKLK